MKNYTQIKQEIQKLREILEAREAFLGKEYFALLWITVKKADELSELIKAAESHEKKEKLARCGPILVALSYCKALTIKPNLSPEEHGVRLLETHTLLSHCRLGLKKAMQTHHIG
jgi:hypothetical protein